MPTKLIDYISQVNGKLCPHCLAGFMDEQYNARVTCGKSNITLGVGIPCTLRDWEKCPLRQGKAEVGLRPSHKTLYDTVPVQIYLIHNVKTPLLEGARKLFHSGGIFDSLKALRQVYRAIMAVKKLPEPTLENTTRRSARNLVEIRDAFFVHCHLRLLRNNFIRWFINLVIILMQMDGPWRMMFHWVKKEADRFEWEEEGEDISRFGWWHDEPDPDNPGKAAGTPQR